MSGFSLIPVFMIGLLGSVHCIGMCGGIVSAFSMAPSRAFPVAVVAASAAPAGQSLALEGAMRVLAYNTGRISSYALAGALAGGLAAGASTLAGISVVQLGGYWLANLMLVALGLYLMDVWRGLARLEVLGQNLWRRLQPLMKRLLPLDTTLKLFAAGSLWGWLPCGMVYSMLLTATLSGSAVSGASVMLAFGLGTLPMLLTLGMLGARLKSWLQRRQVRLASGIVVLGFGLLGLVRAADGGPSSWLDALCITPHVSASQP
jgi:sulfite exporter TauE/SafE